jgi:DNA-directed RNA polymerase subunit E'/Rpb7
MNNPFIDTILYTTVELSPDQLNNNLYSNLKHNLIKAIEKKCFRSYGYISKIYEILEHDQGRISAEDRYAYVTYKVTFSCRLCHPLEGTQIICKVNQNSELFVNLIRDPIQIYVTADRVNKDVFVRDSNTNKMRLKTGEPLDVGMFVKATILAKKFTDKETRIMAFATLDDVATEKEVEDFYSEAFSTEKKFISLEEYKTQKQPEVIDDDNGVIVDAK